MWPFPPRIPRYAPELPFPAYAHQPGRTPHPFRDEGGHHYGQAEPTAPPLDPDRAGESQAYRYGFDLLNHGYLWEAHTAWESLWHAAGREGPTADLLKALIRIAAAGVKARQAMPGGVRTHMSQAAVLLRAVREETGREVMAGIRLEDLAAHCDGVAEASPAHGAHPDLVDGTWTWTLRPDF